MVYRKIIVRKVKVKQVYWQQSEHTTKLIFTAKRNEK